MFGVAQGEKTEQDKQGPKQAKTKKKAAKQKPKKVSKTVGKKPSKQETHKVAVKKAKAMFKDDIPEDVSTYCFLSELYGSFKLEMYSEKSYIRGKDPASSKWKSIIGSTAKEHNKVCRLLVPFVSQGLSVPELYKHRESLLSDLRDVD